MNGLQQVVQQLVNVVFDELKPKFGIYWNVYMPRIAFIDEGFCSFYHLNTHSIKFIPYHAKDLRLVAHEVGHSLHRFVQPLEQYHLYGKDMEVTNLAEMVAEYAALCVSRENSEILDLQKTVEDCLQPVKRKQYKKSLNEEMKFYERHKGGVKAAEFLVRRYGDAHLKTFAEARIEKAKQTLSSLGWNHPLFIPYGMEIEKEIVVVEKDQRILVTTGTINSFDLEKKHMEDVEG